MAAVKPGILILTPFYHPNIGGVETHLSDLVSELTKDYYVYVHTYSPLTTPNVKWKKNETHKNIEIYRYQWIGKSIFHWIEKYPFLDFIYLTPYLFIRTFIWLLFNHRKIKTIHSQGLNAALIGNIFQKIFKIRHITSIHAIYSFQKNNLSTKFVKNILQNTNHVLSLSKASKEELVSIGLPPDHISIYTYWINLNIFKPASQKIKHRRLTILFVGRLIKKKGILTLIQVAKSLHYVNFNFIGVGPLSKYLSHIQKQMSNLKYFGAIANNQLPFYYQQADMICVPSQYEEGFGRVVMESLACGLPAIVSDRGGLKEAVDDTVAFTIPPRAENIKQVIVNMANNSNELRHLQQNCRTYATAHYSSGNIKLITKYY